MKASLTLLSAVEGRWKHKEVRNMMTKNLVGF